MAIASPAERTDSRFSPPSPEANNALGASMVVLGLARAYPDGLGLANHLRDRLPELFSAPERIVWNEFPGALWAIWPILIGLILGLSRSPKFLKGAAIAAIAMGMERTLALVVGGLLDTPWILVYGGGGRTTLPALMPRGVMLMLGVISAIGWIVAGVLAMRANARWRWATWAADPEARRIDRRPSGRLAVLGSWIFALALIGSVGWTSYIDVLERMPRVRTLVLKGDRRPSPRFQRRPPSPEMKKFNEASSLYNEGLGQQGLGKLSEAKSTFLKSVRRFESLVEEYPDDVEYRRQYALSANNLAWFLVTCPDRSLHEPKAAVSLARRAVALYPNDGNSINTLAVAHYRAGDLEAASTAFDRSMSLREGGDSFDWYFLAMIESRRGHAARARDWFDKARAWRADNRARDQELELFEIEAAEVLGLPKPAPFEESSKSDGERPVIRGPGGMRKLQKSLR